MNDLQEILILKRKELKLSLRDASNLIGISHSYLSTLEKGVDPRTGAPINPTPETLRLLSGAYKIPYENLMKAAGYISESAYNQEDTIHKAIDGDPELLEFYEEMKHRDNLKLLFKQTKDMNDKDINQILRIIKAIEDEEDGDA